VFLVPQPGDTPATVYLRDASEADCEDVIASSKGAERTSLLPSGEPVCDLMTDGDRHWLIFGRDAAILLCATLRRDP
jgi:hypothetical protein